jgi:hypothetical protein
MEGTSSYSDILGRNHWPAVPGYKTLTDREGDDSGEASMETLAVLAPPASTSPASALTRE